MRGIPDLPDLLIATLDEPLKIGGKFHVFLGNTKK
jgi:hypothetical protein